MQRTASPSLNNSKSISFDNGGKKISESIVSIAHVPPLFTRKGNDPFAPEVGLKLYTELQG